MGKFGISVAKALADNGCQVMAVDSEPSKVEEIAESVDEPASDETENKENNEQ